MPETSSGIFGAENVKLRQHNVDENDVASTSSIPKASIFRYPRQLLPIFHLNKSNSDNNKSNSISSTTSSLSSSTDMIKSNNILNIDKLPLYFIQVINFIFIFVFLFIFLSQNSKISILESRIEELERVSVLWVSYSLFFAFLDFYFLSGFFISPLT